MLSSQTYQIVTWHKFETTRDNLVKAHYKRNKKKGSEFNTLLDDFLKGLTIDPRPQDADCEPCPNKSNLPPDCEFRKMKWRGFPGLEGSARYGRLLYLVFENKKLVYPLWVYTHAEYGDLKARPPAKEIRQELTAAIRDALRR